MDVHRFRAVPGVEMHVDVDAELPRQHEDAADLPGVIAVVVRRCADGLGAALQSFDHQLVGAGIVGQPLLRKDAEFDVDRPFVLVDARLYSLEAAQSDPRIDFDMGAHSGRAVRNAFLERSAGPGADVLDREVSLHRGHPLDDMGLSLGFRFAAVDDAGFVEVDVGLDKPAAHQPAARVIASSFGGEPRLNRDDTPVLDADIDKAIRGMIGNSGVANDQIHGPSLSNDRGGRTVIASFRKILHGGPMPDALTVICHADRPVVTLPGGAAYQPIIGDDTGGGIPIRTGIQTSQPGYTTPLHSHPYAEILTVLEGRGEAWLAGG